jgi:putative hydrolase of the HAD superfamily
MNLLNWQEIETVFLDMDGTLLDLHYDNHFWLEHVPRRYAEYKNLPVDVATAEVLGRYRQVEGSLKWYCFDYWTETLGLDIIQLSQEVAHLIAEQPYIQEFTQTLRSWGKRVILATNSHHQGIELKMQHTCLASLLDRVICSHSLGFPKEYPDFWQALQQVESFQPAHTLLIDDSLPVLRAARNYGISWLIAIQQPDSRQPPRNIREFTSIPSFQQLL